MSSLPAFHRRAVRGLMSATACRTLAFTAVICAASSGAQAQVAQTTSDQSPPQSLATEQEIKSGQNACDVTKGQPLPANCSPADASAITVTGSRIRRPNLDSPVPVTSIGGQEFFQTGNVSIGDKLAELPSIRGTFTQANSTRFLGSSGLNLLDLRGLGTSRTLVLVNGRRHVGGDVLNGGTDTDVNTIPTDLIDRVDVVTGGDSAVYGSDAIAGVVNFILKDRYQGLQVRGQGGLSKYGDAGSFFVSVLAGQNFADGRGNVAVNAEYAKQNQFFASARPSLAEQTAFLRVSSGDPAVPERLLFRDVRSGSLTNTGLLRFGGTKAFNCGVDPTGSGYYPCVYIFSPDGTLAPATGSRVGLANGSFVGGNSENFRNGNQFQLQPDLSRYNLNLIGHFEVSPAVVPFVEGTFSRTDVSGTGNGGPAFIQGSTLVGAFGEPLGRERIRLDNPFITPQARAIICQERALAGQTCTNPASTISLRENLLGLGSRTENSRRDTYRIVGGLRGNFLDTWNYEVSLNYGRLDESTALLGNLDVQRFALGNDVGVNPATGTIQCRSQYDPTRAVGLPTSDPNAAARLAADVAACVPINPLGGQFSQAVRDYVLRNTVAKGRTTQFDALAFISGDTGKFLNLWGGPIGFSLGAEHREDTLYYHQDEQVQYGYTFYNAIPTYNPPKSKVSEAFGEIRLPILKDRPFFYDLEASAAARVSHYSLGKTGTVWAYNGNVIWAPVKGLRFRGNYSRSVRAPNQAELFAPLSQNFSTDFGDPCSSINIGSGTPNRAANCAAAGRPGGTDTTLNPSQPGVPAANALPYDFRYDESLLIRSGGNPQLQAEKSDSWTLGFVATPSLIPGLSLSVDYYNIKVNNVITGVDAQTIVNNCYDLGAGNSFCNLFQRASTAGGPAGEQPFRIIEGSLIQGPVNFAKRTAKGVDFEVAYRHALGNFGRIDTVLRYTRVLDRSNYEDPTDSNFRNVIVGKNGGELGDPRDSFNWNTSIQHGRFTFGYKLRYVGKQYIDAYEDYNTVQGRPPQDPNYAEFRFYPARFYHDVRLGIDVGPKYNFYLGVDNLTNAMPPLDLTGIGEDAKYDNRGRFFYVGAVAKF